MFEIVGQRPEEIDPPFRARLEVAMDFWSNQRLDLWEKTRPFLARINQPSRSEPRVLLKDRCKYPEWPR